MRIPRRVCISVTIMCLPCLEVQIQLEVLKEEIGYFYIIIFYSVIGINKFILDEGYFPFLSLWISASLYDTLRKSSRHSSIINQRPTNCSQ